ncbi:FAST kinase domain-containing protein 4-like isoform X2 [Liolophura sinensis]|uniref:FAST kinase domain-containing protein 4-like isoform X2 n=1 Tax=Liolophura sinensis TaxID=3198878 RepID=UPI0031593721
MLPSVMGQHLIRCCRVLTRDRTLWRRVNLVGRSSKGTTATSVSQADFKTDVTQALEVSKTTDSVPSSDFTHGEVDEDARLIDPQAHLHSKRRLENEVKVCNTVLSVLSQVTNLKMQPIHAYIVLERLSQLHAVDPVGTQQDMVEALQNPLYLKIEQVLDREIIRVPPHMLLSCLGFMLSLTPEDNHLIKSLETQTVWLMRRFTIGQMVRVLEIHHDHQETELRREMYRKALTAVEQRWVEISNPKDLITLLYLTLQNSPRLSEKLEDKALELAEDMSPKELYRVAYLLAKKRHRNTPLLRAITYHLNKAKLLLSTVQLTNLLYACSTLNIRDINLLEKISAGIRQKGNQGQLNSHALLASILHSFANLRWQNPLTLDTLYELVQKNLDGFNSKDLVTVLHTAAKLNYVSPLSMTLLPVIAEKLSSNKELDKRLWVDVVWSMATLKLLTQEMAASVLSPELFLSVAGDDAFKTLTRHIKLLNIQAAAEHELQWYSGPKLPLYSDDNMTLLRSDRPLAHSVLSVLNSMAPTDQYMKTGTMSESGYYIDADLFVNLSGQPLVYKDFCGKDTAGVKRIAVKVLDFSDLTLDTKVPIGLHAMAFRHLAAEGYSVVQVPYTEFDEKATAVQKVQYLQQKINVAIGKDTSFTGTNVQAESTEPS